MQKLGYIFGHLSLMRNIALNIPNIVATMKDHKTYGALKKEILVLFKAPLFLSKWCVVATYFFLYKKIRKKSIKKYVTELCHLID